MSTATVVFNPASGSAPSEDELRAAFEEHADGHRIKFSPTTENDPGFGQTTEAVENGDEVVIACGGDGTGRAVAQSLVGTGVQLGVVPFGTGNLLAGNLELEQGFDAIPAALTSPARPIDVGRINGEVFAVMAGVGFDALMIRDAPARVKHRMGSVAYVVSALRHLRASRVNVTIRVDGEPFFEGPVVMALIGNLGRISGGLEVFPEAHPADGKLDVAALTANSTIEWARVFTNMVRKRPQPDELVRRACGERIDIELAAPTVWELDGEDRDPTDRLVIEVVPNALEVRA